MKLRSNLVLLALAAMVPLVAFTLWLGISLVERERDSIIRGMQERTLALSTAVDSELDGSRATLEALAVMPSLAAGDLHYFRKVATQVLASQADWFNITLSTPDGQQIMNLRAPEGAPLPNIAVYDDSFGRAVQTGKSAFGNLTTGPVLGRWAFVIRTPVLQDGRVTHVLSAAVNPESIRRIIQAQKLAADHGAVILDAHDLFVARNWDSEKFLGKPASQSLRAALASSPSGWFRGRTVEGVEVYSPYVRSPITGWAVSMGVPTSAIDSAAMRAAAIFLAGLACAILLALYLARLVGKRIADPIASLAAAAESVARGGTVDIPSKARITEIRALEDVLRTAMRSLAEDITERKRMELELEHANRAKDEFLAMLSHELRNPLAALTTAVYLLKTTSSDEAAEKALQVIERQTRHMARLIGDLLDIGGINAGKLALQRERLDLGPLISGVVEMWRQSARLDRHVVTCTTQPAWVDADRARIEQVTANLLDNALKFTPAGRRIDVTVTVEGGSAVLRIADEGDGLDAAGAKVFDLFVQGENAMNRGGMGIGLTLVKRLTELHGGTVEALSTGRGRGTIFAIRLPLAEAANGGEMAGLAQLPFRSRKILLVEDNDDGRRMLEATLIQKGHEVRTAPDGASGLSLAADSWPDIALIDIGLPGLDGCEVARRLRASTAGRRIGLIALTGYGQAHDRQRVLDAGFDVHLVKPVSAERIVQVIGEIA